MRRPRHGTGLRWVLAFVIWIPAVTPASAQSNWFRWLRSTPTNAEWSAWTQIGVPLGGGWLGQPVVGLNADGRMELFVRGTDNALWHKWQTAPNGPFAEWHSLGGTFSGDPAVGYNADGRMEVIVRGTDASFWHKWQTTVNGPFNADWSSLGGEFQGNPAVGRNEDGRMEIFGRGTNKAFWHKWQTSPNGSFSADWSSLRGDFVGDPVVGHIGTAPWLGGVKSMMVLGRGTKNDLWIKTQTTPDGPFTDGWKYLGAQTISPTNDVQERPVKGNPAVSPSGTAVLVVADDGALLTRTATLDTLPWFSGMYDPRTSYAGYWVGGDFKAAGDPAVAPQRGQVFVRGSDNALWTRTSRTWVSLGGEVAGRPAVGQNLDGRLEVFVLRQDGSLWHIWETKLAGSRPLTTTAESSGPPTVRAQGRVRLSGPAASRPPIPICDAAVGARDRNSPAAAGLAAQCLAIRGHPSDRTREVPTAGELAVEGEIIANSNPLSAELRNQQPSEPMRRGFYIGMAATALQTLWGPGKQSVLESLGPAEQEGFKVAVSFSIDRNKADTLARIGAAIAEADPVVAHARTRVSDPRYWLGFDIATGFFGDPARGGGGNTSTGPTSLGVRNELSAPAQRGFDASAELHFSRSYKH